tara:strand:- start:139 stop:831 length:693 start_codon:yes stop_codon:yes gene_type:complete
VQNLSVIVPFFNEENFLEISVQRLLDNDIYNEIILVDDCSTDSSSSIAKKLELENEKVIYLKTQDNGGKGYAVASAISLLSSTHTVIHDADLEYFPNDILEMYEQSKLNTISLILGSRFIGNKKRTNIYLRTFLANRIMSLFFSAVHFYRISDVATCYKLVPTSFLKETNFKENGFSFEIEILSKYLKFNKSVVEVPISYEGRSYDEGKKIKTIDGIMYLINTLKYKFLN